MDKKFEQDSEDSEQKALVQLISKQIKRKHTPPQVKKIQTKKVTLWKSIPSLCYNVNMQKKTLILGLALIGMQNTLATREPLSKEKIEKLKDELIEQKKRIDASGQKAM